MKMSKYFSDARETANENFNSANGAEYLNASGSSAGLGGATSQPYILDIVNSHATVPQPAIVGGAYSNINATNFGNHADITITMGIGGLTYTEFLYQSMNKPFVTGLMYLSSSNASQVLEALTIKQKDVNGNESSKVIIPTVDPYQFQTNKVAITFNWKFDGFTTVTVAAILAVSSLKMYLYPAENVSTGRALTGGQVVKGFSAPDIVKKDKIEVLGAAPQLGMGGRSSRPARRRKF